MEHRIDYLIKCASPNCSVMTGQTYCGAHRNPCEKCGNFPAEDGLCDDCRLRERSRKRQDDGLTPVERSIAWGVQNFDRDRSLFGDLIFLLIGVGILILFAGAASAAVFNGNLLAAILYAIFMLPGVAMSYLGGWTISQRFRK